MNADEIAKINKVMDMEREIDTTYRHCDECNEGPTREHGYCRRWPDDIFTRTHAEKKQFLKTRVNETDCKSEYHECRLFLFLVSPKDCPDVPFYKRDSV